jgi:hypothetical protein
MTASVPKKDVRHLDFQPRSSFSLLQLRLPPVQPDSSPVPWPVLPVLPVFPWLRPFHSVVWE